MERLRMPAVKKMMAAHAFTERASTGLALTRTNLKSREAGLLTQAELTMAQKTFTAASVPNNNRRRHVQATEARPI